MKNFSFFCFIIFILNLFHPLSLFSQVYHISGKITAGGLPVVNAEVIFSESGDSKKFTTISDSSGNYNLQILLTSINGNDPSLPRNFELAQNYPNPFSNTTEILYRLNKQSNVTLVIYNILGQEIKRFNPGDLFAGIHSITWDGTNNLNNKVTPGVYFCLLHNGKEMQIKKMVYGTAAYNGGIKLPANSSTNSYFKTLSRELVFSAEIRNTENTQPKIYNKLIENIIIGTDSIFNFETEAIVPESFDIIFLNDSTVKIKQVIENGLSTYPLAPIPWISAKDIEFYDWSSHCIYLKKDKSFYFPGYSGFYMFPQSWEEKPWIVAADGIPCYAGYFRSEFSSVFYPLPLIGNLQINYYPIDVLSSDNQVIGYMDDRNNDMVKQVLKDAGLFHGGIEVSFDTIHYPINVINGDTATIEYTILIKNNDSDDLYIFDPEKAGSGIFNYYNNGPYLYDVNGYNFWAQNRKSQAPVSWDSTWYTLVESGDSITRTISLKGYPTIPGGEYELEMLYSSPVGIIKEKRSNTIGRYWMGKTKVNKVKIHVD